jgi:hypothetical protein
VIDQVLMRIAMMAVVDDPSELLIFYMSILELIEATLDCRYIPTPLSISRFRKIRAGRSS